MTDVRKITLGEHEIPVLPQRHAYIENRVARFAESATDEGVGQLTEAGSIDSVLRVIGDGVYDLLAAIIPNLSKRIPKYEFRGYASKEAYDARDYDEAQDKSPTFPEIKAAFKVAIEVNDFDLFAHLKAIVDPQLLRAELSLWLTEHLSTGSASSPTPSGESPPSDSGTTVPTSPAGSGPSEVTLANGSGSPQMISA